MAQVPTRALNHLVDVDALAGAGNSQLVVDLMDRFLDGRMLIYASNKPEEFTLFERRVEM